MVIWCAHLHATGPIAVVWVCGAAPIRKATTASTTSPRPPGRQTLTPRENAASAAAFSTCCHTAFFCYRAWRKCSVTHCWWLLWAATHCCCLGCQNPNCYAPWLPLPSPLWRNLWPKWITLAIASVLPPFQSVGYWPPAVSVMHQNLAPSSSGSSLGYFSSDECLEFFRLQFCADCSGPDQVWNLVHCCISLQTLAIEATSVTVLSFCFFLGNPDRGWNDPPKLAFNPAGIGAPTGSGRHRLLNKRVPIPLNPQDTSSSSPLPPTLK